ncbi:DoxX family protein [Streptomyces sp. SJL17-1]|uniref:DoxX family protein n=1 Tax=Streptomyces sp. SJL17-1 TaxID=2967223 RepID=UPI0029662BA4|nr:DoxX family protein [Streptomyces sp. SJL17-1]
MSAIVVVTVLTAGWVGFSGHSLLRRAQFVVEPLAQYGVPRPWWTPLRVAKVAGAAGLLIGPAVHVIGLLSAATAAAPATLLIAAKPPRRTRPPPPLERTAGPSAGPRPYNSIPELVRDLGGGELRRPDRTAHRTLGADGSDLRVHLSHAFGTTPLQLTGATVGLSAGGATVQPGTVRALTFGGSASPRSAPAARTPAGTGSTSTTPGPGLWRMPWTWTPCRPPHPVAALAARHRPTGPSTKGHGTRDHTP